MKKELLIILLPLLAVSILAMAPSNRPVKEEKVKSTIDMTKGILTITARGYPRPDTVDPLRRKYESHAAALLVAQNEMAKKLEGKRIIAHKETRAKYDRRQACILTYEVRFIPR